MSKIVLVYITNPNIATAKKIAELLLKKRLIACANFWPIQNIYPWKGKIIRGKEVIFLGKTIPANWKKIKNLVKKIHPYTIPCIIKIPAEANMEYARWIKSLS